MLQTVDHFEISCLGAPFSWLEKPRNHVGWARSELYGICCNGVPQIHFSKLNTEFNSYLNPCDFWAERKAQRQQISK